MRFPLLLKPASRLLERLVCDALLQTIEQRGGSAFFSQQQLTEMLKDPSHGVDLAEAWDEENRNVMKIIEDSVMFDTETLHPKKSSPSNAAPPQLSDGTPPLTTTVRNDTTSSPRRNEPCPCGIGKKYEKCCLRK